MSALRTPGPWKALDFEDPFCAHIGGLQMLYTGLPDEPVRFGIEPQAYQCNRLGFCHGGLIATLLDIALGVCAMRVCGHDWGGPTISLSVEYLQGAGRGEWIESRVVLDQATRGLLFAAGTVVGPSGNIARGTAIFKRPNG